jgi:hypothetical protein
MDHHHRSYKVPTLSENSSQSSQRPPHPSPTQGGKVRMPPPSAPAPPPPPATTPLDRTLPSDIRTRLAEIEHEYQTGELTQRGYEIRRSRLLTPLDMAQITFDAQQHNSARLYTSAVSPPYLKPQQELIRRVGAWMIFPRQ